MTAEAGLSEIILENVTFRLVEPHIYSVYSEVENIGSYDKFGGIYDLVACNRFYNRAVWGYWIDNFHTVCLDALRSAKDGWVLDAGCGSLAFTAQAYATPFDRPVVLLDQSIRLLRMAKERLINLHGTVPPNMVFLHGDALELPFKAQQFTTIISMNLLHCLNDVSKVLHGFKTVMTEKGTASFTTLIKSGRFADRYLDMLGKAGAVAPRSVDQLLAVFEEAAMPIKYHVTGNMMFMQHI